MNDFFVNLVWLSFKGTIVPADVDRAVNDSQLAGMSS